MKATERAYRTLETILNSHGFETYEGGCGKQVKIIEKKNEYVSVQIWEKNDGYKNTESFENFRAFGHLEVTASIRRMGGEMTAEDFSEAARQMADAQALLEELEAADLSYIAMINGEDAFTAK